VQAGSRAPRRSPLPSTRGSRPQGRLRAPRTKETSLERRFRYALLKAGIPYEANVPLGLAQPDFYFRKARVVVEVDGAYFHSTLKQRRRDVQKDVYYHGLGLVCLRFSEDDVVRRTDWCIAKLRKALTSR
jgi:very-short-patch-repair endonuclease